MITIYEPEKIDTFMLLQVQDLLQKRNITSYKLNVSPLGAGVTVVRVAYGMYNHIELQLCFEDDKLVSQALASPRW
jgi:hypothetical protein